MKKENFFTSNIEIYVSDENFEEMMYLVREMGYDHEEAMSEVVGGWDNVDYYLFEYVRESVEKELRKRLIEEDLDNETE